MHSVSQRNVCISLFFFHNTITWQLTTCYLLQVFTLAQSHKMKENLAMNSNNWCSCMTTKLSVSLVWEGWSGGVHQAMLLVHKFVQSQSFSHCYLCSFLRHGQRLPESLLQEIECAETDPKVGESLQPVSVSQPASLSQPVSVSQPASLSQPVSVSQSQPASLSQPASQSPGSILYLW